MDIANLKEAILKLLSHCSNGSTYAISRMLNNPKNDEIRKLQQCILEAKPKLKNPIYTWVTRIYWILNDINDFPKCRFCGESLENKNVDSLNGYEKHCSKKCIYSDPNRMVKIRQTKKDRYGNENFNNSKKTEQTCLEKYGSKHFLSSEKGLKAKKDYCDKHGVANVFQIQEIKNRIAAARGTKETNPKYWKEHDRVVRKTNLAKYGVESYSQTDDFKEKARLTTLKNYGVENGFLVKRARENHLMHFLNEMYERILNDKYVTLVNSYDEFCEIQKRHDLLKFKCKKCGKEFLDIPCSNNTRNGYYGRCPSCFPQSRSINETLICQWIESLNAAKTIVQSDRKLLKPLEIDIYVPEKKLAIEYDGLYWHSKNPDRMLVKTMMCEEKGIHLIHIFENEWLLKQDIVKSRLKNILGIYDKKIGARECKVREVDSKTSRDFQNENHLQGFAQSSIDIGLYHDAELVSLMTFSKTRFSKKYEWELVRFCNKLGCHIIGSASKLLRYFEEKYHPKSIVSYADRRWTMNNGNTIYDKLGFALYNISKPNYWYFKNGTLQLESRIKYQKHKLQRLLENFDPSKTEFENMTMNNYHRIYDCGNLVFAKEFH